MNKKTNILKLTESAIMIALSTVLSVVKIYQLPLGGSVTMLSMLPIVMIAIKYGPRWAFCVSGLYALVQLMLDIGSISAWGLTPAIFVGCIVFDYLLAYGALGVASFWRKSFKGQCTGIAVALSLRLLSHIISGTIFFGEWENGVGAVIKHTLLYNGSYMLPEIVLTLMGATILLKVPTVKRLFQPV